MPNLISKKKNDTQFILYIASFVFMFFFITNINHIFIGTISRYIWIVIIIISFFLLISRENKIIEMNRAHMFFLMLYIVSVLWIAMAFLRSNVPLSDSISYLTILLIFFSSIFVVNKVLNNLIFENIIIIMSLVYLLQAISVILFFFSPLFKNWILGNFIDSSNIDFLVSFRSRGISGSGAALSVYLSFGFFYFMYLLGKTKRRFVTVYSLFGICLILLAIFLSGRTGFLVCAILIFSLLISYVREGGISKLSRGFFINFTIIPLILPLGFYLFWILYGSILSGSSQTVYGEDSLSVLIEWFLSEFSTESSTVTALIKNHIVIVDDYLGLIFGDPDFLANPNNHTDSGYLRILNNFGIIGFILYYLSFVILFITAITSTTDKLARSLLAGLAISLLFVEIKEPFLHKHLIASSYIFTFVLFTLANNRGIYQKQD